jgi:hypothetical protein
MTVRDDDPVLAIEADVSHRAVISIICCGIHHAERERGDGVW